MWRLTARGSLRAIALIAGVLGRAGERGQQRRLADAQSGVVPWQNPLDVEHFISREAKRMAQEAEEEKDAAVAAGLIDEKPLQREDFLSDDQLLDEMLEGRSPRE